MSAVGLPVAPLRGRPARPVMFYVVTRMDVHGRLAARSPLRLLGWGSGCRVVFRVVESCVVVARSASGVAVSGQGRLRVPVALRKVVGLGAGDQVLMVANRADEVIAVYPASALDILLPVGSR
jgi:hypothetical protein